MTIEVQGLDAAVRFVERVPSVISAEVTDGLATIVYEAMRRGAAAHMKPGGTGKLASSLYIKYDGALVRQVGHDETKAPHAQWVIHGSIPHIISPRNAQMLRWVTPGGSPAFAKRVSHPGYRGDNYLERAVNDALRGMEALVNAGLRKAG